MMNARNNEAGFSLLELLVAMAILSLAIVPMIGNQASMLRNAADLQEKELAMMVAENVAILMTIQKEAPVAGLLSGTQEQGGISYEWTARNRKIPGQKMMMIAIDVKRPGDNSVLAALTTGRRVQ